jgi:formate dehydrogenase iron-sulfur subunit
MELSRRKLLRVLGVTPGLWLWPLGEPLAARATDRPPGKSKGMLVDLSRCVGCGWCQKACREWNGLQAVKIDRWDGEENPTALSSRNWTVVECREATDNGRRSQVFVKRQCMHCLDPACVSACPTGALHSTEYGAVVYDPSRCVGCRYCMVACPYGIPKLEWEESLPLIQKCTFCADRQQAGLEPACAEACPSGALLFGDRQMLIAEAEARIGADPERYVDHIYGAHEFGGTSWLYLSPVPFRVLGFPSPRAEPATRLSEVVALYGTPGLSLGVALLLGGIFWLTRLRGSQLAEEPVRVEEREKR